MVGTLLGAQKGAAKRLGITLAQWLAKRAAGLKWCWRCRAWRPEREFVADSNRVSGQRAECIPCCAVRAKKHYDRIGRDRQRAGRARRKKLREDRSGKHA
jgi:hypothetical protein